MMGLTIKDLVVFLFIINVSNACGQKKTSNEDIILERSLKEFKTLEANKNFEFKFKSKYIQPAYGKSKQDEYFYLYQSKPDLSGNLASFEVCLKNNKLTLISFNKFSKFINCLFRYICSISSHISNKTSCFSLNIYSLI